MLPPFKVQVKSTPSARCLPRFTAPELLQLDFETLKPFEVVTEQYRNLGLSFEGAIALQPSNPIFSLPSGSLVLMPTSAKAHITIKFHQAVQRVGAWVNGARQIRLTAFDRHSNVLMQQHTDRPHYLQPDVEAIELFPQHELEVAVEDISKVVFASDAPFLLDQFFCS